MSRNCVDATIELANERNTFVVLIASRRQIECSEFGGGYVNAWTTPAFAEYVRARDRRGLVLLARDHGGPWQHDLEASQGPLEAMQSAKASLQADIDAGFDILHLDPNHNEHGAAPVHLSEFTARTKELLHFCHSTAAPRGREVSIEIGTDEGAIGTASPDEIEWMVSEVDRFCQSEGLNRPEFLVVQTGTKVMEMRNIGPLDEQIRRSGDVPPGAQLHAFMAICQRHGLFMKEHNADYLSDATLRWHPRCGVSAANVAPEFGVTETQTFLALLRRFELRRLEEQFLALAYESRKWEKWMLSDSEATDEDRAIIAGHYVFSAPAFMSIRSDAARACARAGVDLDCELRNAVKGRIARYLQHFQMVHMAMPKSAVEVV